MGKGKKITFFFDDQCSVKILFLKIHAIITSPTLESSRNELPFVLNEKGRTTTAYMLFFPLED